MYNEELVVMSHRSNDKIISKPISSYVYTLIIGGFIGGFLTLFTLISISDEISLSTLSSVSAEDKHSKTAYNPKNKAKNKEMNATVIASGQYQTRQVGGGKAKVEVLAEGKNAFLGRLTLAGGVGVPEHRDPTEEYLYILKGEGQVTIEDKKYQVKAGSTIYMPANAKVSFKNSKMSLEAIQVFTGPQSAKKYLKWELVKP